MTISNVANGLRSGVCTSTTRPTAPYEGQMIYETDTNRVLVWDNAAWVMIADTDTPPALQIVTPTGATNGTVTGNGVVVGSAVSSVTVSGVFSSDFDNYLILWQGGTMSGDTALKLQLGTTASGYYGAFIYTPNYAGTTVASVGDNNADSFTYAGGGNASQAQSSVTLLGPNKASRTYINSAQISYGVTFGTYTGIEISSTQHSSFRFIPFTGTMTGGTIYVYGYRK